MRSPNFFAMGGGSQAWTSSRPRCQASRSAAAYTLSLHFAFASGHYELPKNSQYASALKNSSLIEANSNELRLTIN
jgi:hypothetical protein